MEEKWVAPGIWRNPPGYTYALQRPLYPHGIPSQTHFSYYKVWGEDSIGFLISFERSAGALNISVKGVSTWIATNFTDLGRKVVNMKCVWENFFQHVFLQRIAIHPSSISARQKAKRLQRTWCHRSSKLKQPLATQSLFYFRMGSDHVMK